MTNKLAGKAMLENAARETAARNLTAFPIVDVDCHHYEVEAFGEIAQYIEHPTIRRRALEGSTKRAGQFGLLNPAVGDQNVAGRIHRLRPPESEIDPTVPHDVSILRQSMQAMGIDYSIVFP